MSAYYNEIDPFAAEWLRNLIAAGLVAPGDVDERDIRDVQPDDLKGYVQCHFFAGIGGWSYALRLAGWEDDQPVWTGSCPCQPFSVAGKGKGTDDERHLWPAFRSLIAECGPAIVLGEQVASKDGREWFAAVRADLESLGYACGAADLCTASVGAPHIRQRLWFVGMADAKRRPPERHGYDLAGTASSTEGREEERQRFWNDPRNGGVVDGVADSNCRQRDGVAEREGRLDNGATPGRLQGDSQSERCGENGRMADTDGRQSGETGTGRIQPGRKHGQQPENGGTGHGVADAQRDGRHGTGNVGATGRHEPANGGTAGWVSGAGATDGFWRDADWLLCRDGKWRPVQPGTFPLADGLPGRVGQLRGYGNAIVPQLAAQFIEAVMECAP